MQYKIAIFTSILPCTFQKLKTEKLKFKTLDKLSNCRNFFAVIDDMISDKILS